jgi:hypothetical protein
MMAPDPDNVGDYLISARSFEEYRAMFAITDAGLTGAVLDCPGGGSSFTAGQRGRGNGAGRRPSTRARLPCRSCRSPMASSTSC